MEQGCDFFMFNTVFDIYREFSGFGIELFFNFVIKLWVLLYMMFFIVFIQFLFCRIRIQSCDFFLWVIDFI